MTTGYDSAATPNMNQPDTRPGAESDDKPTILDVIRCKQEHQ